MDLEKKPRAKARTRQQVFNDWIGSQYSKIVQRAREEMMIDTAAKTPTEVVGASREDFRMWAYAQAPNLVAGGSVPCYYCKTPLTLGFNLKADRMPTLDHFNPLSRGGSSHPNNLRICCRRCNITKGQILGYEWEMFIKALSSSNFTEGSIKDIYSRLYVAESGKRKIYYGLKERSANTNQQPKAVSPGPGGQTGQTPEQPRTGKQIRRRVSQGPDPRDRPGLFSSATAKPGGYDSGDF